MVKRSEEALTVQGWACAPWSVASGFPATRSQTPPRIRFHPAGPRGGGTLTSHVLPHASHPSVQETIRNVGGSQGLSSLHSARPFMVYTTMAHTDVWSCFT